MDQTSSPTGDLTSRRRFLQMGGVTLTGLAAAKFLAACGSSSKSSSATTAAGAKALTNFTVQLSWVKDSEFSQLFLADANGHYKANGVSLKLVAGGADIGAIEGIVAGGKADIGISTDITTVVAAIADGNPLVVIGSLYQSNLNTFMSKPGKPFTSMKSMIGKKIGGAQGTQVKYDAMFKIQGLKPDYTFVPTGYGPDALINGDCDVQSGFLTDEVLAYKRQTGHDAVLYTFEQAGLPSYTLPIYTTTDTLKNNRDALVGFLKATLAGAKEDQADPKAGAKLAAEVYGKSASLKLPEEQEKNAAYVPLQSSSLTQQHGFLWVDPARMSGPIYKGMAAANLKTADIAKVLDTSLLVDAAK
ncbi:MAG: hypothetical protein JWN46_1835 [Acidimicrobiales bacterium]|nr:hypothetical protein [Acidimicrobiales bacterium]